MSGKTLVILQSNYIPWKGYFDLIAAADEFMIFDEVQFTKNDLRNRNKIVLHGRPHWLTIPVKTSGLLGTSINQIEPVSPTWAQSHRTTLHQAYRRAPHFSDVWPIIDMFYVAAGAMARLSDINAAFLSGIAEMLQLPTPLFRAEDVPRTTQDPTERLVEICRARHATNYLSGPAAKSYLDLNRFREAGIGVHFANYEGYPIYGQAMQPFVHHVSILDLLFCCGPVAARSHLKALRDRASFFEAP